MVYKKFVRKLIHYGNKKIFYGYTGCIKSSYENFNLNFSPRIFRPFRKANSIKKFSYYRNVSIFVPTFYTPCITIKNFLITVMYQFSYELFIHPVLNSTFSLRSEHRQCGTPIAML